jgi:RNA polymerase sigma-70 factor, ECF subfamily
MAGGGVYDYSTATAMMARTGMEQCDDAALVEAARTGIEAYAVLYRRYLGRVYRYVRTRTATDQEAEDLTQEIFLRAYEALPRYVPKGIPFAAWLMRIARNHLIDTHRRRRTTIPWEHLPESLHPVEETDIPTMLVRREDGARLRELLMALPDDKRELLALRFVAGLKVHEIALVVGKSRAATEKQLARTLHSLKERYRVD